MKKTTMLLILCLTKQKFNNDTYRKEYGHGRVAYRK